MKPRKDLVVSLYFAVKKVLQSEYFYDSYSLKDHPTYDQMIKDVT